jgi:acyl carrier protein
MQRDPIELAILAALQRSLDIMGDSVLSLIANDPNQDLDFDKLDMDSLTAAQVCLHIEDETGFECDVEHLATHRSLGALADLIRADRAAKNE